MKSNLAKRLIAAAVAVAIAAVSFGLGFATRMFTSRKQTASFDWAIKTVLENYYEDIDADTMLNASLKGFSALMLDKYSQYYTAEESKALDASNAGHKTGVGISYMYVPEGSHPSGASGVLIERVVGNSPAYYSGLRAGEFVSGAVTASGGSIAFTDDNSFASFIDARKDGETFTLVTDRGSRSMAKAEYTQSYCTMSTSTADWHFTYDANGGYVRKTEGGMSFLPRGTAYIRLDQFYGGAAYEMATLMEEFNAENCTSLVLDLRGNGGGYVNLMCDISSIFTGQLQNADPIAMLAVYKNGRREAYAVNEKFTTSKQQLPQGTPVTVLADNGTASASEALIGVLIDNGVIDYKDIYLSDLPSGYLKLTGTQSKNGKSYGKGIMQTTFKNHSTGEALKLTTAKIYWPKGEVSIHDVGLTPQQGCKTLKTDWDVTYGDAQLQSLFVSTGGV